MQCCHIVFVGAGMNDICMPVTGPHSWLLLQVYEVLSPHPHSPITGLHSHHILQNVNPRKKLQNSFWPKSCLPIHPARDRCWGPKHDTKSQTSEHNNITPSTSLQSCTVRISSSAALGKKWSNRSLGLRFGNRQLCLVLSIQLWLSEQSQNGCF